MNHPPREPTSDECSASAVVEHDGCQWLAAWYPQMGGYTSRCWVQINGRGSINDCFDCYVWHDGEFPFGDGQAPAELHHCDARQFVKFGVTVLKAQKANGGGSQ